MEEERDGRMEPGRWIGPRPVVEKLALRCETETETVCVKSASDSAPACSGLPSFFASTTSVSASPSCPPSLSPSLSFPRASPSPSSLKACYGCQWRPTTAFTLRMQMPQYSHPLSTHPGYPATGRDRLQVRVCWRRGHLRCMRHVEILFSIPVNFCYC